jgi:hypothetical protein
VQAALAVDAVEREDEDEMKKSTRIMTIVAGCVFFGVAMGFRESFESIWMRAAIAAVAGAVLGGTIMVASRKRSE